MIADVRVAVSQRRRWCPEGETHQDEDDPVCGWDHEWPDGPTAFRLFSSSHRLRIRRMLVCSECEQGYFTQEVFDEHGCFSAY